jgi:hypothetical protein
VPGDLDGRSLAPLLAGGPGLGRQAISIASQSPYNGVPAWRGVRTTAHTYARYGTGETELYDNVADPFQLRNLAGGSAVRALQQSLEERSAALAACAASRCRALEGALLRY